MDRGGLEQGLDVDIERAEADAQAVERVRLLEAERAARAEAEGFEAHERLELVLEYFDLVWPRPADLPAA